MRLAVVALVAIMLTGCSGHRAHAIERPRLQFIGDSITYLSEADIHAHFDVRYQVSIDASIGLDTFYLPGTVAAEAKRTPDVEVINLGTNDANRMHTPQRFGPVVEPVQTLAQIDGRLDQFAADFPPTTCVVFVTVDSHNPDWSPAGARAIDAHIRTFPHVADWDRALRPADFDKPDQPHPNEVGRQSLIKVEDQAIARCPK